MVKLADSELECSVCCILGGNLLACPLNLLRCQYMTHDLETGSGSQSLGVICRACLCKGRLHPSKMFGFTCTFVCRVAMCMKENLGPEEAGASVLVAVPISTCTDGECTISVQLNPKAPRYALQWPGRQRDAVVTDRGGTTHIVDCLASSSAGSE